MAKRSHALAATAVLMLLGAVSAWPGAQWRAARAPLPAGPAVTGDPVQTLLAPGARIVLRDGHAAVPLATYDIRALVLSSTGYTHDRGAAVSPLDLALAWNRMSDPAVLASFEIRHRHRWLLWRPERGTGPPIPEDEIAASVANVHIIPSPATRRALTDIAAGDVVQLRGFLVRIEGPDGYVWTSSLSRTDTDGGACELMLVTEVTIEKRWAPPAFRS